MFKFDEIEDFQKHIELSIPNYSGLVDSVMAVALSFMDVDSGVADIGCSSGNLLNLISDHTDAPLHGCDVVDMGYRKNYKFHKKDAVDFLSEVGDLSVITSLFTLQFMGSKKRAKTLSLIKNHIERGAVAIIAEKVYLDCPVAENALFRQHQRAKLKGFSASEILDKDLSLSGSMFIKPELAINKELAAIGDAVQIWQSYNFKCWVVRKKHISQNATNEQ